ncbi:MAG: hypothetical protein ABSG01_16135 [Anaerolineales bacterium]
MITRQQEGILSPSSHLGGNHFPNVEIEKFVVMPDHVHGVIFILENNSARVGAQHDLKESKILS